ncbi:MAG: glycosyltransferase family 1 protein [Chloroflexi bacterium]|nr:glycosyltransferase family 1 protein [Chloroflexota bacterium]
MRMLFTFVGGSGHFEPLLPIAQAARAAGHTVAFACSPSMVATVENSAFTVFAIGTSSGQPPERRPLLAVDMEREERDLREGFARDGARFRAPVILALCAEWQPDVVVYDETDFGSAIAAERLGLPHATVLVIAAGSFVRKDVLGDALDEVRAEHSLPPDPELAMLSRYLVLSPFPPSYRDPAFPLPATGHAFRSRVVDISAHEAAPSWLANLPAAPSVYFTLGTIFNLESGDLFTRVLTGLRDLPINLIVTVGRHIDPAEFGPQPANIHIERFIPQAAILPRCNAVVSHGGSGSVMGTLAHGLPAVLLPMGADQPLNAARCADLGVAQVLDPLTATPEIVREAVTTVLTDARYSQAAQRLQAEITALPGPEHAVDLLERLAIEKLPIRARP